MIWLRRVRRGEYGRDDTDLGEIFVVSLDQLGAEFHDVVDLVLVIHPMIDLTFLSKREDLATAIMDRIEGTKVGDNARCRGGHLGLLLGL